MRSIREWRIIQEQHQDGDMLMNNLKEIGHCIVMELRSYHGNRFPGFLELIGAVNEFNRLIADIEHGIVPHRSQWASQFREWRTNQELVSENLAHLPAMFLQNLKNLTDRLRQELDKYRGERFQGFDDVAQGIANLNHALAKLGVGSTVPAAVPVQSSAPNTPPGSHTSVPHGWD